MATFDHPPLCMTDVLTSWLTHTSSLPAWPGQLASWSVWSPTKGRLPVPVTAGRRRLVSATRTDAHFSLRVRQWSCGYAVRRGLRDHKATSSAAGLPLRIKGSSRPQSVARHHRAHGYGVGRHQPRCADLTSHPQLGRPARGWMEPTTYRRARTDSGRTAASGTPCNLVDRSYDGVPARLRAAFVDLRQRRARRSAPSGPDTWRHVGWAIWTWCLLHRVMASPTCRFIATTLPRLSARLARFWPPQHR